MNQIFQADSVIYANNRSFEEFVHALRTTFDFNKISTPFIDATNYKGNVDFKMSNELTPILDISSLKRELKKFDLDLIEEYRLTEAPVINEKKE